jgi:hypothetical protein
MPVINQLISLFKNVEARAGMLILKQAKGGGELSTPLRPTSEHSIMLPTSGASMILLTQSPHSPEVWFQDQKNSTKLEISGQYLPVLIRAASE